MEVDVKEEKAGKAGKEEAGEEEVEKKEETSDRVIPANPDMAVAQLRFLAPLPGHTSQWDDLLTFIKVPAFSQLPCPREGELQKYEMGPYYGQVCGELGRTAEEGLVKKLKSANTTRLSELEAKITDAEANLGESEVQKALQRKAEYLSQIGAKEEALSALRKTFEKTVGSGNRIDNVFHQIRIGLFFTDHALITAKLEKAKGLMEQGGDWDRKNRLKAYEALYLASVRDFAAAAPLFLEAVPTFTATELLSYKDLVFYTCVVTLFALSRPDLRKKVVASPEINEVLYGEPQLKDYIRSLYECRYADFFQVPFLPPLVLGRSLKGKGWVLRTWRGWRGS